MQNSGNTRPMSLKISCSDWLHRAVVWNLHFSILRGWPVSALNLPAFDFDTFPNSIWSLNFIHKLYAGRGFLHLECSFFIQDSSSIAEIQISCLTRDFAFSSWLIEGPKEPS